MGESQNSLLKIITFWKVLLVSLWCILVWIYYKPLYVYIWQCFCCLKCYIACGYFKGDCAWPPALSFVWSEENDSVHYDPVFPGKTLSSLHLTVYAVFSPLLAFIALCFEEKNLNKIIDFFNKCPPMCFPH